MNVLIALALMVSVVPRTVHQWTFDTESDRAAWQANAHLAEVGLRDGALHARSTGWDPFFVCDGIEIPATPWQMVMVRIRASKPGRGNLFWTGDPSGSQGGFSEDRQTVFSIPAGDGWHDIAVYPFWQNAGVVRKLRLDVYEGAEFEIDAIAILNWGGVSAPASTTSWDQEALSSWHTSPDGTLRWAEPVALDTSTLGWATLTLGIPPGSEGVGALVWGTSGAPGVHEQSFSLVPGRQVYNLELQGVPGWNDVVALGLRVPGGPLAVTSLTLSDSPSGPVDLEMTYFGVENGINRAGSPANIIAQFSNRGGSRAPRVAGRIEAPDGLAVTPLETTASNLEFESRGVMTWTVRADRPGTYPIKLTLDGGEASLTANADVVMTLRPDIPQSDYVPEPRPVRTGVDIAAYYFPGWNNLAKWDPIKRIAPMRKPVLGWYDEANPEIVDWQIKWAVENGISVFLVDWYWIKGSQHLDHWLEAYKKSRYRDQLKIALMWANHNPPGSHSAEDWKHVSDHWITEYFPMESYYRINGKPAVFLWDHRNIRNDLGGSEAVAEAFATSQAAAQAAGFGGIHYVGLHPWGQEAIMEKEGYHGATRYHEWGMAEALADDPLRMEFSDVVATAAASWQRQRESQAGLTYYPVVDTGWDSRPWHGDRARVILGRTPALFEQLLQEAKTFATAAKSPLVVLGPMNEWGEGSYIEPNTEFGFAMMNAVRNVFGQGDPATWPPNIVPADVGLGPYDMPEPVARDRWNFTDDAEGWETAMGLGPAAVSDGALVATTLTRDPAFVVPLRNLRASDYQALRVRMQITGKLPERMSAQLFWSREGESISESASVRFPLKTDGAMHEYMIALTDNARWRGDISQFRFDPCDVQGLTVRLEEFVLLPVSSPERLELAVRILADERLDTVLAKARTLLATGLTAGEGYGEVWIRDLNTFIEVASDVVPHAELRAALLRFFHFQGADGNIIDGYTPASTAGSGYDYIKSTTDREFVGHKNTVETDQESSLIQAVCRYVRATGDRSLLDEVVNGKTVTDRLVMAVDFLHTHRYTTDYGLLWGATTADWGDVQPEHEWGVVLDASSHRAIDIYDNALCIAALNELLAISALDEAAVESCSAFRDTLKANVRKYLWDTERRQFRPHVYLEGSPFPADFNEGEIYYHGGTAVAMEAGLLSREEVGFALARMRANVVAAGAASVGLTMYPAYPEGYFKNPILTRPYTYQNGGDWTWFGGRLIGQLVAWGYEAEAYTEIGPMLDRVLKNGGFYEWYTLDNQPSGSGAYRGAAGVLGKAILALKAWAEDVMRMDGAS